MRRHITAMGELVFKFLTGLFEALLELVCFYTARFILPVVSFGKLTVQPLRRAPAYGKTRPIVVPHIFAAIFGLVFWGFVAIAAFAMLRPPVQ